MSSTSYRFRRLVEGIAVLVSIIVLTFVYIQVQEPNDVSIRLNSDEVRYLAVATQFRAGEAIAERIPQVFRIGSPYIASLMPIKDISDAFFYWEMSSAVLAVLLLYVWLRFHLRSRFLPVFFMALTVCTLWGPVRATTFHTHGIEGSTFLWLMCSYFALYQYHRTGGVMWVFVLAVTSSVGVTTREFCLVPALALPFVHNPLTNRTFADMRPRILLPSLARVFFSREKLLLWLPLACGLTVLAGVHALVTPTDKWSYVNTVAWGFSDLGPLRYLASMFNALGPLPLIVFFVSGYVRAFLKQHQMFAITLVAFLPMSWSAFADERYFVWIMPILFVMIGRAMERHFDVIRSWPTMLLVIVFELISVRAFFPLVEPGRPRVQKTIAEEALARYLPDGWHFTEMTALKAEPKSVLAIVGISLIMGSILWLMMNHRRVSGGDGPD